MGLFISFLEIAIIAIMNDNLRDSSQWFTYLQLQICIAVNEYSELSFWTIKFNSLQSCVLSSTRSLKKFWFSLTKLRTPKLHVESLLLTCRICGSSWQLFYFSYSVKDKAVCLIELKNHVTLRIWERLMIGRWCIALRPYPFFLHVVLYYIMRMKTFLIRV